MRLALRTTVEGFSAGTRIQTETPVTEKELREGLHAETKLAVSCLSGDNLLFDCKVEDIVILRKRGNCDG
jgi:hypothetical protein